MTEIRAEPDAPFAMVRQWLETPFGQALLAQEARVVEESFDGIFGEQCLLEQAWVKDPNKTVEQVRKELVGSIGENIQVRRFARMELGG